MEADQNERAGGRLGDRDRVRLRRVLQEEDSALDRVDDVLDRRDALLRELRGRGVAPEALRAATRSRRHPDGLGRTTLYRAFGRKRDQAPSTPSTSTNTHDDEQR